MTGRRALGVGGRRCVLRSHPMTGRTIAAALGALALAAGGGLGGAEAQATAPPVLYHVSHRADDGLRSQVWSSHARIRRTVSHEAGILASQQRPRHFSACFADSWAQVVNVRDRDRSKTAGLWLPNGRPNMVVTPQAIYDRAVRSLERNADWPPSMIVIDEVTANTSSQVQDFALAVEAWAKRGDEQAQAILDRLAFYVVGGDSVRPRNFTRPLVRFLARTKSPVYAELYGGKLRQSKTRKQVERRTKGTAIKAMQRHHWNVRPMVSAAPMHIGSGPKAIKRLKWRVDNIKRNTGLAPAYWHISSADSPAAWSLSAKAVRWSR